MMKMANGEEGPAVVKNRREFGKARGNLKCQGTLRPLPAFRFSDLLES